MIILHAAMLDCHLYLWGETSHPDDGAQYSHPYAAPADSLLQILQEHDLQPGGEARTVTAWLPTAGTQPLPSDPVLGFRGREGDVSNAGWTLPAIPLHGRETVDLMLHCRGHRMLRRGVMVGRDLAYWTEVLPIAATMVAEGLFIPNIAETSRAHRATWDPVFAGDYAGCRAELARAMPAACRALTPEEVDLPPETPSPSVLDSFAGLIMEGMMGEEESELLYDGRSPTPHDSWLDSLAAPGGTVDAPPEELDRFTRQMEVWHRRLSLTASGPFSLLFRLEEPEEAEEDAEWNVQYLLRAAHDPSLLVPAEDVWAGSPVTADINDREILLSSLGLASSVCPQVGDSLHEDEPTGFTLDTEGAYQFLTRSAPALRRAGFAVALPSWCTSSGSRHQLRPRPRLSTPDESPGGHISLDDVVHVDWELALGDESLSWEELQTLAEMKTPLVQMRGKWVEVTDEDLRRIGELWDAEPREITAREALPLALSAEEDGATLTGWIADLSKELTGDIPLQQRSQPEGLRGSLRPYQLRGYSWLCFLARWGLGGCLADDMGLGKTVQTLALIQRRRARYADGPSLVVCPTSILTNWEREIHRFTPDLSVLLHHGPDREQDPEAFSETVSERDVVLTSYGLIPRDFPALRQIDWDGVILDESQNIKNPDTKRARAARSLPASYRVALTGTPVENHVGELWSLMDFLNPGLLGNRSTFRREFFRPIQMYADHEQSERLRSLTSPFILRRLKTDETIISDLPEKMETEIYCRLTREQASLYAAVVRKIERSLDEAEDMSRRGQILAGLTELKQVCNHPALLLSDGLADADRSGKLTRLLEMLEEILAAGDRTLIFTQFTGMGRILRDHLQETFGYETPFLHGGTPATERQNMIDRFQDEDGPPFFLLSLRAGGTGVNLTRANHVFHFDRWWNPAVENQATDRAFRIGQNRDVYVHKFLTTGTVEEKIARLMREKQDLADSIVGSDEGWLTEMSTERLREILRLREGEVMQS